MAVAVQGDTAPREDLQIELQEGSCKCSQIVLPREYHVIYGKLTEVKLCKKQNADCFSALLYRCKYQTCQGSYLSSRLQNTITCQ